MATKKPAKKPAKTGDGYKPGPSRSENVYPTREEIGKTKTDALRRKAIKGDTYKVFGVKTGIKTNKWERDTVRKSRKGAGVFDSPQYKYKGAGSKAQEGNKRQVPIARPKKRITLTIPSGKPNAKSNTKSKYR